MKKKILFINPSLRQGGVEHSLITALKALDPERYDVTLFLYTDLSDLLPEVPEHVKVVLHPDKTRYFRKPYCVWKMLLFRVYGALGEKNKAEAARKNTYAYIHRHKVAYPAKRLFANEKFDAVVSYSLHIGTEMGLQISANRRYVLMHSSDPEYHREIIERSLIQYDNVIAVSESVADVYRKSYPFLSERIITIPNYVDAERTLKLSRAGDHTETFPATDRILATCGRLSHEKGFDLAVNAAEILKNSGISFVWFFIGDGAERGHIESAIHEKDLDNEIRITGFLENPFPFMNECDIYVQPSYEEAQPLVLLEALILGKAIVSTDTVGGRTILANGKKGVLTPITADGLAAGIKTLITDDNLRRSFENLYTLEDNLREKHAYEAAWNRLLSE